MDVLLNTKKEAGLFSGFSSDLELNRITDKNSVFDAFDFFMESAITNSSKTNRNDIDYLLYDDDEEEDDDIDLDEDEDDDDFDDEEWDEEFEWDEDEEWDDDDDEFDDDDDDDFDEDEEWDDEPNANIFNLKEFTIN